MVFPTRHRLSRWSTLQVSPNIHVGSGCFWGPLYRPLYLNAAPILHTSRRAAELIK